MAYVTIRAEETREGSADVGRAVSEEKLRKLWSWREWRTGTLIEDRSLALCRICVSLWLLWSVKEWTVIAGPHLLYGSRQLLPSSAVMEMTYSKGHFSLFFLNSSSLWHCFLFTCMAAASVLLLLGLRTRSASLALWLLTASLSERFSPVTDNGDQLIRLVLFFGSLSSWGRRLSLDSALAAAHGARPPTAPLWKALGNVGLLSQVLLAQLLFAATLTGSTYADGSAVRRLLSLKELLGGVGHVQSVAPWVAVLYVWWLRLAPALMLLSFLHSTAQTAVVAMHTLGALLAAMSFGPMLAPTFLAFACCVPCFLPSAWWSYMQDTMWSPERQKLRLFFDGFSTSSSVATALLPVVFLLHPRTKVADGRRHGDSGVVFRTESIWWVVDGSGQQYDHAEAVPVLLEHSLVLWPLAVLVRRMSFIRSIARLIYGPLYYVARRHGSDRTLSRATYFGSLSASDAKLEDDRHEWSEAKESLVENHFLTSLTILALVLLCCSAGALYMGIELPPFASHPTNLLRLDQDWRDPLLSGDHGNPWKWDFYWSAPALLSDLTLKDLLLDFPLGVRFDDRLSRVQKHPRAVQEPQRSLSGVEAGNASVVDWTDEEWATGLRSSQPSLRGYEDTTLTGDRRLVRLQLFFMERMRHQGDDLGMGSISLFYVGESACDFWNREQHKDVLDGVDAALNRGIPLSKILGGNDASQVEEAERELEEMRGNPFDARELVVPFQGEVNGKSLTGLRFMEVVAVVKDVTKGGQPSIYSMWLHSCSADSAPLQWIDLVF